jgi:flagellar hook-basal body complex protein FliE
MSLAPIDAISIRPVAMPEMGVGEVAQSGSSFMQMVGSEVGELNGSLNDADASVRALAAGENIPVHAHLKLQFAVEVRNRIVDAYQNLTNMQM